MVRINIDHLSDGGSLVKREMHQRRSVGFQLRSRAGIVLLTVVVVLAIVVTAGSIAWHGRQSALKEHQHSMNSMGIVIVEQTASYVQVLDVLLREVQTHIRDSHVTSSTDFSRRFSGSD